MPYFRNHAAATGHVHNFANHEEAITSVLEKNGFTKVLKTGTGKFNVDLLSNREFIEQPNGTHRRRGDGEKNSSIFSIET